MLRRKVRGACIVKGGIGLNADADDLASLGFNYRSSTGLEPDILITVKGRPHAFLLFDELRFDAGALQTVIGEQSNRLINLQRSFRHIYLLIPGSYGHAAAAALAARHPSVPIFTCNGAHDAVGTATRLMEALCEDLGEGNIACNDLPAQRLAVAVDESAVSTTCVALEEIDAMGATDVMT